MTRSVPLCSGCLLVHDHGASPALVPAEICSIMVGDWEAAGTGLCGSLMRHIARPPSAMLASSPQQCSGPAEAQGQACCADVRCTL